MSSANIIVELKQQTTLETINLLVNTCSVNYSIDANNVLLEWSFLFDSTNIVKKQFLLKSYINKTMLEIEIKDKQNINSFLFNLKAIGKVCSCSEQYINDKYVFKCKFICY